VAPITNNGLLIGTVIALSLFWWGGAYLGNPALSTAISIFLVLAGALVFMRFGATAFKILFLGVRSDENDGSHLAALGVALLSFGAIYSGLWNFVWVFNGQPETWLGTPHSNLGRAIIASGFVSLFFSPDALRPRLRIPNFVLLAMLVIIAIAVAFYMGASYGAEAAKADGAQRWPVLMADTTYPVCPPHRTVWGSGRSKLYHTESSPYRRFIIPPSRCFKTVMEAEKAGFKPYSPVPKP